MEFLIIGVVSAIASLITLFSGFGLGTILTPVFLFFFPIEIAITLTGIVHLFNNLFKFGLLGKHTSWAIVVQFGIPSIFGAALGAELLLELTLMAPWIRYGLWGTTYSVLPAKIVIAVLIIIFAFADAIPHIKSEAMSRRNIAAGGILSGFFGGLSGFQGALRSAFLIQYNLSKEQFLATGIVIACLVDFTRLSFYSNNFLSSDALQHWDVVAVAVFTAFAGVYVGNTLLQKVTILFVQRIVAVMLTIIAIGLGMGLI
ncbi:MAG: TSUP family transporter [Bacteriovoracaceae bacterium]|nr:TSUP family transporter [Bacteroidota bacterium]